MDVSALSVIHVAGTKGKGSVCSFADSVLRRHGVSTGCYISPHLVEPRERIRLGGRPISRDAFVDYFWRTIDLLEAKPPSAFAAVPPFFRFLTCMALYVFHDQRVDACVMEVGVGGRTCPTNVVQPFVCGITRLGMDHMDVLGPTLTDIAFEKAGIMKEGVPCFTVPQLPEGATELQRQAHLRPSLLTEVRAFQGLPLQLEGDYQQLNAALGLVLARYWLAHRGKRAVCATLDEQRARVDDILPVDVESLSFTEQSALHQTRWRGRAQVVERGDDLALFLDGAHTGESIRLAVEWFDRSATRVEKRTAALAPRRRRRVLFCNFKPNKQVHEMLGVLKGHASWDAVVLVGFAARATKQPDTSWQMKLQQLWNDTLPPSSAPVTIAATFAEAMASVEQSGEPTHVLVTGSLYLTGAALDYLRWNVDDL